MFCGEKDNLDHLALVGNKTICKKCLVRLKEYLENCKDR